MSSRRVRSCTPVSYTHLDVYKRQNPARSTGVALFAGPGAISQLWMFWVAPILGGLIGGILYGWLGRDKPDITGHG